ncbi:MAG: hypothetical protein H6Q15_311 [Bacteroidetes bacterium]|nr:hypothetical protein [Bacteroidota bacterium]
MKSENIYKYAFNWGSAIGAIFFVYLLLGYILHIDGNFMWDFLGSIIIIFGTAWAMTNYKRNVIKKEIGFSRLFLLGTISSLVVSFFTLLYMILYIIKLDPNYFNNIVEVYQDILDKSGSNIDALNDKTVLNTMQILIFPSIFIADFIGNLFYTLLLSILISLQRTMPPTPDKYNDYTPYKKSEEDKEDVEEKNSKETEINQEDKKDNNKDNN